MQDETVQAFIDHHPYLTVFLMAVVFDYIKTCCTKREVTIRFKKD